MSLCEAAYFTKIFKEYAQTLRNFLFYKTGNAALSDDLTQESFTRLWQNCDKVIPNTAKGYVFRIANNLLLNQYQHQKIVLRYENLPHNDRSEESPQYLLEAQEFRTQLETAIANLPEKQRIVFLMSRIDKMKYQDIADALGISKKAVEKRMYLALDQLRKVVSPKIR